MLIARIIGFGAIVAFSACSVAGCHSSTSSAEELQQERVQIIGTKPPADAGAKYLSSHGNDPNAIRAKIDAAGAAFQNRKQ